MAALFRWIGELHERLWWNLVRRHERRCWLAGRAKRTDERVHRTHIRLRHRIQRKIRHGGAPLHLLGDLDPWTFSNFLKIEPQVGRISRTPGSTPTHYAARQPVLLRGPAAVHEEIRRMTIVAARDRNDIPTALYLLVESDVAA